ncbi:MAG: hypothetical protein M5U26_07200 [Planctomycetota bacterium]|nr:hypothetical protein [Planctomycetota bacterium]
MVQPRPARLLLAAALGLWAAHAALHAGAPAGEGEIQDVSIVVAGEPYLGALLKPPSDTGFSFRLRETGNVLKFRWSSLERAEAQRIRELYGLPAEGEELPEAGFTVRGVRLRLQGGREMEGLEQPDRARPGFRALKTASQLVQVPIPAIEAEEPVELDASKVYSAQELYERRLFERPPAKDSAAEQLDGARWCARMRLYEKALDHLQMALAIDPRLEERSKEFQQELVFKHAEQLAARLYGQILSDMERGLYGAAVEKIERLKRSFNESPYYTKADALQPRAEKLRDEGFRKQVVFMYYALFDELLQAKLAEKTRVDLKGRPVPSVPGVQVTTRQGHIFRGALVADRADSISLKQPDGLAIEIPAKDVLTRLDVDLSVADRAVDKSFDELKAYAIDAQGGLGKDILARVAKLMRADEAKVRDAWNGRFNQTAEYQDGRLVKSVVYAKLHEANYGRGSWLRDGSPYRTQAGNRPDRPNNSRNPRRSDTSQTGTGASNMINAEEKPDPEASDEPNVWWTGQRRDLQLDILRAMAAEKLFKVKQVQTYKREDFRGEVGYKILYE